MIIIIVIVIAVIAILAAVLIPTFSGVVDKANQSAALQTAKNAETNALVEFYADGVLTDAETYTENGITFTVSSGDITVSGEYNGYEISYVNDKLTATKKTA